MNISPNPYASIRSNTSHQLLVPDTLSQIVEFVPVHQRATYKAVCTIFNEVVNKNEEHSKYASAIKTSAERIYKTIKNNIHILEEEYYNQAIQSDSQQRTDYSLSRVLSILTNTEDSTIREITTLTEVLQGTTSQHEAQVENAFLLNIKLAEEQSIRSRVIQSVHNIAFSILRIFTDIVCGITAAVDSLLVKKKIELIETFSIKRKFLDKKLLTLLQILRVNFVGKKTLTFSVEFRRPSHTQSTNIDPVQQRDLSQAIFKNINDKIFIDSTLRYLNNNLLSNLEEMEKADSNLQDISHPKNIDEITTRFKFLEHFGCLQASDTNILTKANKLDGQYKRAIIVLQGLNSDNQVDENIQQACNKLENCRKNMLETNCIIPKNLEHAEKTLSELETLIEQTI